MQNKFYQYPSTKHFKESTGGLYKHCHHQGGKFTPTITGTIKLHGTNFAIVKNTRFDDTYDDDQVIGDEITFQKRTGLLRKEGPFYNYQQVVYPIIEEIKTLFEQLEEILMLEDHEAIILFGELIGGEIQKGVALEQLDKKFVIFDIAIKTIGSEHLQFLSSHDVKSYYNSCLITDEDDNYGIKGKIYNIYNFKTWNTRLNIHERSEMLKTQNKCHDITLEVEKECPFAKYFGVSGVGEGVVWKSDIEGINLKFKVKGDEHTNSKVKTLKGVSDDKIAELKNVEVLAGAICTDARFKQGVQYLYENPPENEYLRKKVFIEWVVADTLKEEIDTIIEAGVDVQKAKAQLYKNAVNYWQIYCQEKL